MDYYSARAQQAQGELNTSHISYTALIERGPLENSPQQSRLKPQQQSESPVSPADLMVQLEKPTTPVTLASVSGRKLSLLHTCFLLQNFLITVNILSTLQGSPPLCKVSSHILSSASHPPNT